MNIEKDPDYWSPVSSPDEVPAVPFSFEEAGLSSYLPELLLSSEHLPLFQYDNDP